MTPDSRLVWTPYEPDQINHHARSLVDAHTRYDSAQAQEQAQWTVKLPLHRRTRSNILPGVLLVFVIIGYITYRYLGG